jgi:hypothetical protein
LSRCTSRNGHRTTFFAPVCPVRSGVNTTMVGVRADCGWKNSLIPVGTTQSRIQQAVVFRVSEPGSSIHREEKKEEPPFAWNQSGKSLHQTQQGRQILDRIAGSEGAADQHSLFRRSLENYSRFWMVFFRKSPTLLSSTDSMVLQSVVHCVASI